MKNPRASHMILALPERTSGSHHVFAGVAPCATEGEVYQCITHRHKLCLLRLGGHPFDLVWPACQGWFYLKTQFPSR